MRFQKEHQKLIFKSHLGKKKEEIEIKKNKKRENIIESRLVINRQQIKKAEKDNDINTFNKLKENRKKLANGLRESILNQYEHKVQIRPDKKILRDTLALYEEDERCETINDIIFISDSDNEV